MNIRVLRERRATGRAASEDLAEVAKGVAMAIANSSFSTGIAPCGRLVNGESYEDRDDQALLTAEMDFACGCRAIGHEYHDGSVSRTVIRHDGRVLLDELLWAQ
jgi:hypothetical protein